MTTEKQKSADSTHFVHKHKTTELHCSCGTVTELDNYIFCGRIECKNCFKLCEVSHTSVTKTITCPACKTSKI